MTEEYYQLINLIEIDDTQPLTISRAEALLTAIRYQRDYSLVQILQYNVKGIPKLECLVVDVECDGVPPKNSVGIRYRERLALCVPDNPKHLIEILALRKDFPILIHQNQGIPNVPASLCLYFEPPNAVMRTWTPQNFFRRIQWWLEKSARGELHPADQPVEHLFFASKYELILPWNLAELRKNLAHRFIIIRGPNRPDGGFTLFLEVMQKDLKTNGTAAHIELVLPPVLHGFVERDPATLGQLSDILIQRKTDLICTLRSALHERVGETGVAASADDKCTVILLQIPICRIPGAEPERVTHRAFMLPIGALELGISTGALLLHQGKYFKDVMNTQQTTAWRDQEILSMDVLTQNDAAAARRQSGISDEGPAGILIGAGSLGSALLNLWGRNGWGRWTVIDKDHIKPHNLSRHTAYVHHIGNPKAEVVAALHAAAMGYATEIVPLVYDASDFTQEPMIRELTNTSLVVDASTTLEYPRYASTINTLARHISVFLAPNGNAAVLLAEDATRSIRLRTLEAQYYRALILASWGQDHLSGNVSTFWSGASCRDISVVLPYSRILGQASTLAEQIQLAAVRDDAWIRIWQRDPLYGTVEVHDIPVMPEKHMMLGEFDLFIDAGVERQLRTLRTQNFPNETGGVLLGYYDFNVKSVVVVAGLPAPSDSKSSPGSFERGIAGLAEAVNNASKRTSGIVNYIGEWHSHPPGHSALPSRDDFVQLIHLALGMADDGLPGFQLIVGEHDLQILQGVVK